MAEIINTFLSISILLLGLASIFGLISFFAKNSFAKLIAKHSSLLLRVILVGAALGSLTYELILGYSPCTLCWYQRMALFPLAILVFTANIKNSKLLQNQVLTIATIGFGFSLFHNIIDRFPSVADVCGTGPSCLLRYVNSFGFVTIQMMAGITLLSIITITLCAKRFSQNPQK